MTASSLIWVGGGLLVVLLGRHGLLHAEDRRDSSGGIGSWMSPPTRRFWASVLMVVGFAMALFGALV
jgi:hypothetical protein